MSEILSRKRILSDALLAVTTVKQTGPVYGEESLVTCTEASYSNITVCPQV